MNTNDTQRDPASASVPDSQAGIAGQITAMVLTYNEEPNISRTLDAIGWVGEILVVDSGSTDGTLNIVRRYKQVRIVTRKFDTFAEQCNFGLGQITSPWVLSLDADYELTPELAHEIRKLHPASQIGGYRTKFIYRIFGRALSATLYPPRTVLYRRELAAYRNEGHGHRVSAGGEVRTLAGSIWHDDRKPLARWIGSQQIYARREADYLLSTPDPELRGAQRVRKMAWPAPVMVFLYTLIWKGCIFEGWPGWLYVLQRTLAETIIAVEIIDRRLRRAAGIGGSADLPPRDP